MTGEPYRVTGMTCAACSARVEKAVRSVDGVTDCSVNLLTGSMLVEGTASREAVCRAVTDAGYGIAEESGDKQTDPREDDISIRRETSTLVHRLTFSAVLLVLLMYLSMGSTMWGWPLPEVLQSHSTKGLAQLLLSAGIMIVNGRFFVSGGKSLLRRAPNMDTLVALGSAAAFVYSTCVLFETLWLGTEKAYYFESAGMILTLITVGKMLEARAKGKTTDAIRGLMALRPDTATLLVDGKERTVPVADVRVGDRFILRPGDSVPVDGQVVEGRSAVDESAMTGESIPVDKTAGDSVSAATVNQSGFLLCQATRVGEDTTLSKIIQMVSDASATKAPIARVADRVAAIFVPTVILLAVLTVTVWLAVGQEIGYALARGVSVLVISCPCALGLATPVAVMVGSGVGARNGILYKTAAAMETVGRVTCVALDKTGTITLGQPRVTDLLPVDGITQEELLVLAATAEQASEHPLARAICACAEERQIPLRPAAEFTALPGSGIRATVNGTVLLGGNRDLAGQYTSLPQFLLKQTDDLAAQGKTPLYFVADGRLIGVIAVADTLKPDSAEAVAALRNMGIRTIMLTGDNAVTAQAVAQEVGVDTVVAGVKPDEKMAVIRREKETGTVAMVGDGINDAPALTQASVGIAIGAGADVAVEAADVVLVSGRLSDVVTALRLSRAALRNIRQNLFWAFFYNCLGIPLAAGLFVPLLNWELSPMIAAAAMSLSSICVVSNALRLNFFRPGNKTRMEPMQEPIQLQKERKQEMEIKIKVNGMMCGHCESHVKKALEGIEGVVSAAADHVSGQVLVTLEKDVPVESLKGAIIEAGYEVEE